jgi:ABC-2 type transport system ATP-binding protein
MIAIRSLTRSFDDTVALRDLSLTIATGEMFALIGPDGAGKTTFFRILTRLLRPTSGEVRVEGHTNFGFVPQRFALYPDLTIDENLTLRARLYGLDTRRSRARASELLARVGLDRFGARLAGNLSGGMKQKLALVAALLIQPDLLLLDEPTTGVDPVSRREFWAMLHRLHHEGLTIVVSTPYMDEAEYATRLGFLHEGRLLDVGTREDIVGRYPRPLFEVRAADRVAARERLRQIDAIDDISVFGTVLHVRGRAGAGDDLEAHVRASLHDLVVADGVRRVRPSLEDVFVLHGESAFADAATSAKATADTPAGQVKS